MFEIEPPAFEDFHQRPDAVLVDGHGLEGKLFPVTRALDHQGFIDQADGMARDAIASFLDVAPDGFDVSVTVRLPSDLQRDVAGVIDLRGVIDRTEREYAERTRHLARRLVQGEGLTVREAGRVLGLSYQRVSQLVATAGPA